jgi:hypothetical protein
MTSMTPRAQAEAQARRVREAAALRENLRRRKAQVRQREEVSEVPTLLRTQGFRVYFYSREPGEPPHVHVDRSGASAKVWLETMALASNTGFPAHELGDVLSLVRANRAQFLEAWHGFSIPREAADIRVREVSVSDHELSVSLMDGRTIVTPLAWYPRLANATPAQRAHWQLAGAGYGIHWPDVDEDLSTESLLLGQEPPPGSETWRSPLLKPET